MAVSPPPARRSRLVGTNPRIAALAVSGANPIGIARIWLRERAFRRNRAVSLGRLNATDHPADGEHSSQRRAKPYGLLAISNHTR